MYHDRLASAGYTTFQLARTNARGDVSSVPNVYSLVVLENSRLGTQLIRAIQKHDWNGSKRGHVYKFLRSQGFISSYDVAHQYTDSDAHRWVSHRNHRGNICGVDFIWLCNPTSSNSKKPLRTSWVEAVFSIIKYQVQKASIAEDKAFAFLGENNHSDSLTYSGFCQALQKVNLTGMPHGLSFQETKELWDRADVDGNGVFDYEELKKMWSMTVMVQSENCKESVMESKKEEGDDKEEEEAVGLKVKKAVLFPQEAERGLWPENYSLSDHACLTVQFSPVKVLCTLWKSNGAICENRLSQWNRSSSTCDSCHLLLGAIVAAAGEEEKKAWVRTVAGNLTLLDSAANLIVCEQARRTVSHGYTLTFNKHLKYGLLSTFIANAISLFLIK
ncbi:unnamed protein product [Eruca vesicaria subsp. sativa]|uniref:EF-hand domain-containing protein n=1 Tax=Eruca vesicaria subsp. sativa TaxID=29727 RepID=A0ABC8K987_ERUVS|nr:unnamed protein product [Eruca vesicaria subsp. sativa]